jgi:putative transposase
MRFTEDEHWGGAGIWRWIGRQRSSAQLCRVSVDADRGHRCHQRCSEERSREPKCGVAVCQHVQHERFLKLDQRKEDVVDRHRKTQNAPRADAGGDGHCSEHSNLGDTTEFVIGESGKLYLAAILDLFSRFVVGWAVSAVNDRHLTLKALGMALKRRCPAAGLLHHSDRGSTYASEDYQRMLDAHGITGSMSHTGDCYDNAVMEAFFSTVKTELADRFESCNEAKMQLFDYIEVFYNQRRRHSTIGYVSPGVFERRCQVHGVALAGIHMPTSMLNGKAAERPHYFLRNVKTEVMNEQINGTELN